MVIQVLGSAGTNHVARMERRGIRDSSRSHRRVSGATAGLSSRVFKKLPNSLALRGTGNLRVGGHGSLVRRVRRAAHAAPRGPTLEEESKQDYKLKQWITVKFGNVWPSAVLPSMRVRKWKKNHWGGSRWRSCCMRSALENHRRVSR